MSYLHFVFAFVCYRNSFRLTCSRVLCVKKTWMAFLPLLFILRDDKTFCVCFPKFFPPIKLVRAFACACDVRACVCVVCVCFVRVCVCVFWRVVLCFWCPFFVSVLVIAFLPCARAHVSVCVCRLQRKRHDAGDDHCRTAGKRRRPPRSSSGHVRSVQEGEPNPSQVVVRRSDGAHVRHVGRLVPSKRGFPVWFGEREMCHYPCPDYFNAVTGEKDYTSFFVCVPT